MAATNSFCRFLLQNLFSLLLTICDAFIPLPLHSSLTWFFFSSMCEPLYNCKVQRKVNLIKSNSFSIKCPLCAGHRAKMT